MREEDVGSRDINEQYSDQEVGVDRLPLHCEGDGLDRQPDLATDADWIQDIEEVVPGR